MLRWWRSSWWRYLKGVWTLTPTAEIESDLSGYMARLSRQCGEQLRRDVLAGLQGVNLCGLTGVEMPCFLSSSGEDLESAEGWIAVGDKLIHPMRLTAGGVNAIRKATPRFFSTHALRYGFDLKATCPQWEAALSQWHPDLETRRHLQMMAGLAISGDKRHNVFFVLPSLPGTGKSTFADVLAAVIGRSNISNFTLSSLGDKSTLGVLCRSSLAICRDSEGERDRGDLAAAEEFLKLASGGEEVSVRELHRNGYSTKCRALIVMFANELPGFRDRTKALQSRMRVIPFHHVFRDSKEEVLGLSALIIEKELPGVLNWALEGAAMAAEMITRRERFPELEEGRRWRETHFIQSDSARAFIAEHLQKAAADSQSPDILARQLFSEYQKWAKEGGYSSVPENHFVKAVKTAFPEATNMKKQCNGKRQQVWSGIARQA